MRRYASAVLAGITATVLLTACSSDKDNRHDRHSTAAPTVNTQVAPVPRTSSFHVAMTGDYKGGYDVTFKRGSLTGYKPNLSAATQITTGKFRNNLGMVLGTGCKLKAGDVAYPFSISVTGTVKGGNTGVVVKFTTFTRVAGTKVAAPQGSVKMEFMQSSGTPRCHNLDEGDRLTHYMTFGSTIYKTTQTMNGWIILNAAAVDHYDLAVTSGPMGTLAKQVSKVGGEFKPYREQTQFDQADLTGGYADLIPGSLH